METYEGKRVKKVEELREVETTSLTEPKKFRVYDSKGNLLKTTDLNKYNNDDSAELFNDKKVDLTDNNNNCTRRFNTGYGYDDYEYIDPDARFKKIAKVLLSSLAILLVLILGGGLLKNYLQSRKNKGKTNTDGATKGNAIDTVNDEPKVTEKPDYSYNYEENTVTINETNKEENTLVLVDDELTTENFENLVAGFAKTIEDNNLPISTKDAAKFVSIVNIDKLCEENPDLLTELAGTQTREEYLNDAAKVIGASVMDGFTKWNNTNEDNLHETKDFIRISEAISGSEQKTQMLRIENYMDNIAEAVNEDNADLVNSLVTDFITELNSGSLSKLDDGVGFGAQVCIALISDGIAKDYLNQENFDMFQELKTSAKYVSNIFTEYERCQGKTLTLHN